MFHLSNAVAVIDCSGFFLLGAFVATLLNNKVVRQRDAAQAALREMHKITQDVLTQGHKVTEAFESLIKTKDGVLKSLKRENNTLRETCDELHEMIEDSDEIAEEEEPVPVYATALAVTGVMHDNVTTADPSVANVAMELYDRLSAARTQVEAMAEIISPHDLEALRNTLSVTENN